MTIARRIGTVALAAIVGSSAAAAPAAAASRRAHGVNEIRITTIPATPGVRIVLAGRRLTTGPDGSTVARVRSRTGTPKNSESADPGTHGAAFEQTVIRGRRWPAGGVRLRVYNVRLSDGGQARFARYLGNRLALALFHRFTPRFEGPDGRTIDPAIVDGYRLKSRTGAVLDVRGARSVVLQSSRVVPFSGTLLSKDIEWSLERVVIDGANVVNRAQNRFLPHRLHNRPYLVRLLFYPVRVTSVDALFGFNLGSRIVLRYPSGRTMRLGFTRNQVVLPALPRGTYQVKSVAPGLSPERPLAVSRAQDVQLKVISWLDLALAGALLGSLAVALLVVRRPHLRRAPWRRRRAPALEPMSRHRPAGEPIRIYSPARHAETETEAGVRS